MPRLFVHILGLIHTHIPHDKDVSNCENKYNVVTHYVWSSGRDWKVFRKYLILMQLLLLVGLVGKRLVEMGWESVSLRRLS